MMPLQPSAMRGSPVRSNPSLIYSRNLDGLGITVDTQQGMVNLSGKVLSNAEKQLAVETARNIRGVRGVDADALRVDS